ncbi:Diguanylate cyclase [Azospirillaceae bacterium]
MQKKRFRDRGLTVLSAFSAAEAEQTLLLQPEIAVVLLDVVMETEDAGLRLVKTIREDHNNQATRIILRTGQPGQAPEEQVIVGYDINDYRAKEELTAQRLFTTVIAALRSHETIVSLENSRRGVERLLASFTPFFGVRSLSIFSSMVLTQLEFVLSAPVNGIFCFEEGAQDASSALSCKTVEGITHSLCDGLPVLATYGDAVTWVNRPKERSNETNAFLPSCVQKAIRDAIEGQKNVYNDDATALYLPVQAGRAVVAMLQTSGRTSEDDRRLLDIFASKIAIAMTNIIYYEKMVSLEEAAVTDFLTGLSNRRQLLREGTFLLANARRAGTPLALAMIDIDHFKNINDSWGHDAGDMALQYLGKILKSRFRKTDLVARFGGEEFCVMLPGVSKEQAVETLERFLESLRSDVIIIDEKPLSITVSIGISALETTSIDEIISAADKELYRAKHAGRNRIMA